MTDFAPITTLTFDCYGTIIDWETGIREALDRHATRREFAAPETPIAIAGPEGVRARFSLAELLPASFGPANLPT